MIFVISVGVMASGKKIDEEGYSLAGRKANPDVYKRQGAEITHEAAIGKIASEKLWGLMAKGLTENEAVDVVVSGLLR